MYFEHMCLSMRVGHALLLSDDGLDFSVRQVNVSGQLAGVRRTEGLGVR